jgi:hypothetical protein
MSDKPISPLTISRKARKNVLGSRQPKTPPKPVDPVNELEQHILDVLNAGHSKRVWPMIEKLKREYKNVSTKEREYEQVFRTLCYIMNDVMGYNETEDYIELKKDITFFDHLKAFTRTLHSIIKTAGVKDKEEIEFLRYNICFCVVQKVRGFPENYLPTLKAVVGQYKNIEAYIDTAFPGYLKAGLLHLLAKGRLTV